jgi:hypothetical protein
MWWTVTIRNGGVGEAEIKIRSINTFRGSRRYVRRLQKRYCPHPALDPDPPAAGRGDPSLQVGVGVCGVRDMVNPPMVSFMPGIIKMESTPE